MEQRTLLERLARHLAAANPDRWQDQVEDAASLLAIIKDPDEAMREAGDGRVWQAMIDAALRERWTVASGSSTADPPAGTDEEGEIPLPPDSVGGNHAEWVHLHEAQEKRR
ncbi:MULTISPECIES: hypothetical protein [Sphingobium]|uniref:hypothetical protein n=1 Tax=Sphingobium TaxID=165695 RepID=UPI00159C390C|nr:hypothetical protein [Sphingobium sp. 15-1]